MLQLFLFRVILVLLTIMTKLSVWLEKTVDIEIQVAFGFKCSEKLAKKLAASADFAGRFAQRLVPDTHNVLAGVVNANTGKMEDGTPMSQTDEAIVADLLKHLKQRRG